MKTDNVHLLGADLGRKKGGKGLGATTRFTTAGSGGAERRKKSDR